MKTLIILFFFFLPWNISAQLITNAPENNKKTKASKDTASLIYLDFQRYMTSPHVTQNTDFLNIPLGERANETALKAWSFQFGVVAPISRHLAFDGGLALIQNGEQYQWNSTSTDSSYDYTTKYRYFGMPIQLKYQTGKDLVFFVGAGLTPQLFQSYEQKIHWTDSLKNNSNLTLTDETMCQSFVLSATGSAGIQVHFKSNYGLRLSLNYRYQLTNSYGPYQDYKHFSTGIGGGIALTRKL